jgi:hypothetical protein
MKQYSPPTHKPAHLNSGVPNIFWAMNLFDSPVKHVDLLSEKLLKCIITEKKQSRSNTLLKYLKKNRKYMIW